MTAILKVSIELELDEQAGAALTESQKLELNVKIKALVSMFGLKARSFNVEQGGSSGVPDMLKYKVFLFEESNPAIERARNLAEVQAAGKSVLEYSSTLASAVTKVSLLLKSSAKYAHAVVVSPSGDVSHRDKHAHGGYELRFTHKDGSRTFKSWIPTPDEAKRRAMEVGFDESPGVTIKLVEVLDRTVRAECQDERVIFKVKREAP